MKLKDIIKEYQDKTGCNNVDIAKALNVSKTTVGRWLNGEIKNVQEDSAIRLSKLIGFDVTKIIDDEMITFKKPILGMVKAGYDLFLDDNYIGEEELSFDEYRQGDFFLEVSGDSMMGDGIIDGSLVYVKKTNHVSSGKIAIVQVGDEVTVKKVIYKDNTLILEASNPQVANRYFSAKEISEYPINIIGEVIFSKKRY